MIGLDPSWQLVEIEDFPGFVDIVDVDNIRSDIGALESKNMYFLPGQVATRKGFHAIVADAAFNVDATSMYSFHNIKGVWLFYSYGTGLSTANLVLQTIPRLFDLEAFSPSGSVAIMVPQIIMFGERLYMTLFGRASDVIANESGVSASGVPQVFSLDPHADGAQTFTGTGLNDATIGGTYTGYATRNYRIVIDGIGTPDTFKWSDDGGHTFQATGVAITGAAQSLSYGVTVTFGATTGHTLNDRWDRKYSIWRMDGMFQGPYSYTPGAPTEPGAGKVTAGLHRLGYIIEHRGGLLGRISPHTAGGNPRVELVLPVEFTSTGSMNLQWILNPTVWPNSAVRVHVVMSPVSDKNTFYFVPGAFADVPGGSASSKTITINIDDATLVSTGKDATKHMLLLTSVATGSTTGSEYGGSPLAIFSVFRYGERVGYITNALNVDIGSGQDTTVRNDVIISDRQNPEHVTYDQNRLVSPIEFRVGQEMGGQLYLFGPGYTYRTYDNGLTPSEWPIPVLVDGEIGVQYPRNVIPASDGDFLWVAHTSGFYLFNGGYTDLPMSYLQRETWMKINKKAWHRVQVVEDAENKRVYVLAPLLNSTDPTYLFVWDYSRGKSYDMVRCSNIVIDSTVPKSMCMVDNLYPVTTLETLGIDVSFPSGRQLLVNGFSTGRFLSDSTSAYEPGSLYVDIIKRDFDGVSDTRVNVNWAYETGRLSRRTSQVSQAHLVELDVKGLSVVTITLYGKDKVRSFTVSPITLSGTPGKSFSRLLSMISEDFTLRMSSSDGGNMVLSKLRFYESPYALRR